MELEELEDFLIASGDNRATADSLELLRELALTLYALSGDTPRLYQEFQQFTLKE